MMSARAARAGIVPVTPTNSSGGACRVSAYVLAASRRSCWLGSDPYSSAVIAVVPDSRANGKRGIALVSP